MERDQHDYRPAQPFPLPNNGGRGAGNLRQLSGAYMPPDRGGRNERPARSVISAISAAAIAIVVSAAGYTDAKAEPVEYVRVCDAYGVSFFYIPGTDTCINPTTGETRRQTEIGTKIDQSELAGRVSDTEGGIQETQAAIDATNADLAKTNKQVAKQQKQIDDLEQSQAELEQRFDNAFDESMDGIAVAMALAGADLISGERFAMKFNLGTYSGHNAFGFSASAVLARTDFGRVTVSGGVATTGQNTGGNAGVQLSW